MPLENPNYLNDLVQTNPAGLDQRSEGDDHLRNLKKAIVQSFPGITGRVWRTVNKTASGSLTINDNMTLQNCAAGINLSPASASTLGNGWMTLIRAPSTGSVGITPGQNINGRTTYTVPAGHIAILLCNGTEFFAVIAYAETPATVPTFPSGTAMLFHQTTAPTGWTKRTDAAFNNAGLRLTTGTVGTGGADAFSTVFSVSRAVDGHTLTLGEIPPHTHYKDLVRGQLQSNASTNTNEGVWGDGATGSAGGGGAHSHTLSNMNLKYADVIIAQKD